MKKQDFKIVIWDFCRFILLFLYAYLLILATSYMVSGLLLEQLYVSDLPYLDGADNFVFPEPKNSLPVEEILRIHEEWFHLLVKMVTPFIQFIAFLRIPPRKAKTFFLTLLILILFCFLQALEDALSMAIPLAFFAILGWGSSIAWHKYKISKSLKI